MAESVKKQLSVWNQRRLDLDGSSTSLDSALADLMDPAGAPIREALLQLRDEASALEEDQRFF